jgi:hypothetical protein
MFERLGGVWFGLGVVAIWSLICALLLTFAHNALLVGVVAGLWLLVIVPTAWGLSRSRLG